MEIAVASATTVGFGYLGYRYLRFTVFYFILCLFQETLESRSQLLVLQ